MQAATTESMKDDELAPTKEQLLALRMVAYGLSTDHLELLTSLLLGGRMTFNFFHDHWTTSVQDYLDGKPLLEVHTVEPFVDMVDLLPPGRQSILLIDKQGKEFIGRAVTSLRFEGGKGVELPVDMHIVHESAPDRGLPDVIRIDCAGLGGHDLGGPEPWHVCLRSDRHGQNIYGPSLAPIETTIYHPKKRPCTSFLPYTTLLPTVPPVGTHCSHRDYQKPPSRMRMKGDRLLWTCSRRATLPRLTGGYLMPTGPRALVSCWTYLSELAKHGTCAHDLLPGTFEKSLSVVFQQVHIVVYACYICSGNCRTLLQVASLVALPAPLSY